VSNARKKIAVPKKIVIGEKRECRFDYTIFGEPPAKRTEFLYLSMHGGGGTGASVQRFASGTIRNVCIDLAEGVLTSAPRAPTDTLNLFGIKQTHR